MFQATYVHSSLDENTVAGSIWPGSRNVRKEGAIIFPFQGDIIFWHFLIKAKMSDKGHFR
jgi:hypothetical protein